MTFKQYKKELIRLFKEKTGRKDVKINSEEAYKWYKSGIPAYYCFRENI